MKLISLLIIFSMYLGCKSKGSDSRVKSLPQESSQEAQLQNKILTSGEAIRDGFVVKKWSEVEGQLQSCFRQENGDVFVSQYDLWDPQEGLDSRYLVSHSDSRCLNPVSYEIISSSTFRNQKIVNSNEFNFGIQMEYSNVKNRLKTYEFYTDKICVRLSNGNSLNRQWCGWFYSNLDTFKGKLDRIEVHNNK